MNYVEWTRPVLISSYLISSSLPIAHKTQQRLTTSGMTTCQFFCERWHESGVKVCLWVSSALKYVVVCVYITLWKNKNETSVFICTVFSPISQKFKKTLYANKTLYTNKTQKVGEKKFLCRVHKTLYTNKTLVPK